MLFGAFTLVTGPLWARKAWGVWWVWDARLTSSLMLFLIFVAYLLLRKYGGPGSDKLGAGMALFGMANVPFIYVSVNYWRTLHPPTSVVPTLPVEMGIPLWYCVAAFTLLFMILLRLRARLEHQRARVEALYLAEDECDDAAADLLVLSIVSCLASHRGMLAQQQPPPEFVPVEDAPPGEQIPAMPLLGAAYGFIWVGAARLRLVDRAPLAEGRSGARRARIAESGRWISAFRPPRTSSSFPRCC